MKKYEKPMIFVSADTAEGVYLASGDDCYTVTWNIHQRPETGRGDYRIQFNAAHAAGDGHHSGEQTLVIFFNQPVVYVSSNGSLHYGDGTTCLEIKFNYHNNASDNIGMGDVVVTADAGLDITDAYMKCNHDCGQH